MATIACSSCDRPVPAGARFCPSCGTPVGPIVTSVEERRVVTVLFADLVGYTAIAEHLDPEAVKRLVDSCFAPLVIDIESFGGRVDKVLGDAIVALFGAPVAHEDDADRAVRAALRMQDTLSRFVADRAADGEVHGAGIQMRIGINTGEVLVGTLAGTDYTAMGDVVNTASRLQSLAPPGGVLIGGPTEGLLSSAIAREPFGVTQLRGREQSEQPWLVIAAAATSARPLNCDLPFVGRVHERLLLDSAIALVRAGHSGVVSIVGEAGAGKSRLADEIVTALADEAIVVQTACAPYGESSLWSPMRNGLATLLDLDPDATPEGVRKIVEQRSLDLWSLRPGDEALEQLLGVIAYLFGHRSELDELDPAGVSDRITGVVTEMMRRHAQTRMTVLWVDNLQWADPVVRDLLAVTVRSLADLPFLLITSQRPTDDLDWPPAQLDRPLLLRVPLAPLDRDDAAALVRAVLEREGQPGAAADDALVNDLVERGGGNPLFLFELAALAACAPARTELPGSLRALIAARLDQLPASRRAIVDNAAVLGSTGSTLALEEFATAMGQEFALEDVEELAADGVLDLDGGWWRFRSDVVREVAYQTLTKRTRAQRHAGVALALASDKGQFIEDLAHHAATAAELVAELGRVPGVPRSLPKHAVHALHAAAREALDSGRPAHAIRYASRALDLRHADPDTERAILLVRATAELDLRRLPAAEADAQRALETAVADGDVVAEGEARRRLGTVAALQGDLAGAREQLDAAISILRSAEEPKRLANALRARGFAEVFGGSLPTARHYLGEAMALFEQLGDERGQAWASHNLAWATFLGGDFVAAESLLDESRRRFDQLGDRVGGHWAEGLMAYVTYFQRRFDEAEALATEVMADATRWGDVWAQHMMQTLLANMRLWTGRIAEAEQLAERALAGFREAGDRYGVMTALGPLNRAKVALGKDVEAQRGAEEAITLGRSYGELGMALQSAAGVAMHRGDAEQALVLADQVIARNETMGASVAEAVVIRTVALCQLGRLDEALAAIEGIDVTNFPFGRSARALGRGLTADAIGAEADATAVEEADGASYFDVTVARIGATIAMQRRGDNDRRDYWFERLRSTAASSGDVAFAGVAQALAGHAPSPEVLGSGWRRIVEQAVAA